MRVFRKRSESSVRGSTNISARPVKPSLSLTQPRVFSIRVRDVMVRQHPVPQQRSATVRIRARLGLFGSQQHHQRGRGLHHHTAPGRHLRFGYYFENYHDFGFPSNGTITQWLNSGIGGTGYQRQRPSLLIPAYKGICISTWPTIRTSPFGTRVKRPVRSGSGLVQEWMDGHAQLQIRLPAQPSLERHRPTLQHAVYSVVGRGRRLLIPSRTPPSVASIALPSRGSLETRIAWFLHLRQRLTSTTTAPWER